MIDSHTHLDLLDDAQAALDQAQAAGLVHIVTVGTHAASVERNLAIAQAADERGCEVRIDVAAGLHPNRVGDATEDEWKAIEQLAREPRVVAIGETGLDNYRPTNPPEDLQMEWFVRHCALARERGLPLIIHTRAAEEATLAALREHAGDLTVIMHCFSMPDHLDEVLAADWYVSFAGNVTYPSAGNLREAAMRVPARRLLVETDAPYLTPVPHRGTPNEPAYTMHTLACLAEARGDDVAALGTIMVDNASRLFVRSGAAVR